MRGQDAFERRRRRVATAPDDLCARFGRRRRRADQKTAAWRSTRASASSPTVVNSVKNDFELRFFLAMVENQPYSSSSNRRGEDFFRREDAVNSDELFVAGEVR
jgi:hypothetical protein